MAYKREFDGRQGKRSYTPHRGAYKSCKRDRIRISASLSTNPIFSLVLHFRGYMAKNLDHNGLTSIISQIKKAHKNFLRPRDLIDLGVFRNTKILQILRKRGGGPPSVQVSKNTHLYPVEGVAQWLQDGGFKGFTEDVERP